MTWIILLNCSVEIPVYEKVAIRGLEFFKEDLYVKADLKKLSEEGVIGEAKIDIEDVIKITKGGCGMEMTTEKVIQVQEWDRVVQETYGRQYGFQQQDGCKQPGVFRLTVPDEADRNSPPDGDNE